MELGIISIILSFFALAIAIISLCVSYRESERKKPQLKISYHPYSVGNYEYEEDIDHWFVIKDRIRVSNVGYNPTTIVAVYFITDVELCGGTMDIIAPYAISIDTKSVNNEGFQFRKGIIKTFDVPKRLESGDFVEVEIIPDLIARVLTNEKCRDKSPSEKIHLLKGIESVVIIDSLGNEVEQNLSIYAGECKKD